MAERGELFLTRKQADAFASKLPPGYTLELAEDLSHLPGPPPPQSAAAAAAAAAQAAADLGKRARKPTSKVLDESGAGEMDAGGLGGAAPLSAEDVNKRRKELKRALRELKKLDRILVQRKEFLQAKRRGGGDKRGVDADGMGGALAGSKRKATDASPRDAKRRRDRPAWVTKVESLHRQIRQKDRGGIFHNPVDPDKLGIPDYFNIIKNPMDLKTAEKRLSGGLYTSPLQWRDDIRLMYNNSLQYNGPGTPVHEATRVLKDFFEQKWGESELEETWNLEPEAVGVPRTSEMDALKQTLLQEKAAKQAAAGGGSAMTEEQLNEKRFNLASKLGRASQDQLGEIVDILQEAGFIAEGGEILLEVELMDVATLFKIDAIADTWVLPPEENPEQLDAQQLQPGGGGAEPAAAAPAAAEAAAAPPAAPAAAAEQPAAPEVAMAEAAPAAEGEQQEGKKGEDGKASSSSSSSSDSDSDSSSRSKKHSEEGADSAPGKDQAGTEATSGGGAQVEGGAAPAAADGEASAGGASKGPEGDSASAAQPAQPAAQILPDSFKKVGSPPPPSSA